MGCSQSMHTYLGGELASLENHVSVRHALAAQTTDDERDVNSYHNLGGNLRSGTAIRNVSLVDALAGGKQATGEGLGVRNRCRCRHAYNLP